MLIVRNGDFAFVKPVLVGWHVLKLSYLNRRVLESRDEALSIDTRARNGSTRVALKELFIGEIGKLVDSHTEGSGTSLKELVVLLDGFKLLREDLKSLVELLVVLWGLAVLG